MITTQVKSVHSKTWLLVIIVALCNIIMALYNVIIIVSSL